MITNAQDERCYELRGLSTDEKPLKNVFNGTIFIEIDTGKIFFYNADGNAWIEFKGAIAIR